MLLLILFSFLAGLATALSPCVLPVLPAILSAGLSGSKKHSLAIIIGLVVSFSFFTLFLTTIVKLLGIDPNILRFVSIAIIAVFGLILIFPKFSDWFARFTYGIGNIGSSVDTESGLLLGAALGLVWTPCAGPILASVSTLALTSSVNSSAVILVIFYSLGVALPLVGLLFGGQKLLSSVRGLNPFAEKIRKVFGVLMVLTAIALVFNFDRTIQVFTARYLPFFQVDTNSSVTKELSRLKNTAQIFSNQTGLSQTLPVLGPAPELTGITGWVNTDPITLQSLRGKVVLIDFWTYSCINCIRTLPHLISWYDTYKDKGFVIIGVHSPEFEFEKEHGNVVTAAKQLGVTYPIAQDNNLATWTAYQNQYWPAHYLLDKSGNVRYVHFGEGEYDKTEQAIQTLLKEAGATDFPTVSPDTSHQPLVTLNPETPETYLGYTRGNSYTDSETPIVKDAVQSYRYNGNLIDDQVGISGEWKVESERITSGSDTSTLTINYSAAKAYLVLSGTSSKPVIVKLDGQVTKNFMVTENKLYTLAELPSPSRHTLELTVPSGISAYAFTFGGQ
ncbi:MAG TPA: cytochrome c biogenesis protein DipZ [Patescibacteria group bacterium]|nr:cytochrome c biogenesis protein DipZ [Patescibacteria group bacterium]